MELLFQIEMPPAPMVSVNLIYFRVTLCLENPSRGQDDGVESIEFRWRVSNDGALGKNGRSGVGTTSN